MNRIARTTVLPFALLPFTLLIAILPAALALEIGSTGANGLAVHAQSGTNVLQYNRWNFSVGDFNSAANAAQNVGGVPSWVVVRANHERDELVAGTLDTSLDINIQFFNGTTWYNLTEVTATADNAGARAFDLAAEDRSGDWLLVYENSATANANAAYRTINTTPNGSIQISNEFTLQHNLSGEIRWVKLIPRPRSNAVMVLVMDLNQDIDARLWNGTDFDNNTNHTITRVSGTITEEVFDFAWEGQSGDGVAVYGSNGQYQYRNFTFADRTWSPETSVFTLNSGGPNAVHLCAQPLSDYVGMIFQDSTSDVNVRMWNGTTIEGTPAPPSEDATTNNPTNAKLITCFWNNERSSVAPGGNNSVFAFVDSAGASTDNIKYTTYNRSAWNVSALESAGLGPGVPSAGAIGALSAAMSPSSNETILTLLDTNEDMSALRWNGIAFAFPTSEQLQNSTACLNGAQFCAEYDWERYDSPPTVVSVTTNTSNFPLNTNINLSANVTDSFTISVVRANITFPNGSTAVIQLFDANSDGVYNGFLNFTDRNGQHNFTIIANDTSTHDNVNGTQSANFLVGDFGRPNVTNIFPAAQTDYTNLQTVNISANVTDDTAVDRVLVNLTHPNRSTVVFRMINLSMANFSALFNDTTQIGRYNVTIVANDTVGNLNDTQGTTFNVGDARAPTVTFPWPNNTNYARNASVNVSTNVTDDTAVDRVLVNLTYPNGSTTVFRLYNSSLRNFTGLFNDSGQNGRYNFTIVANDTAGNRNDTVGASFTAGDVQAPAITLSSPANQSNSSSNSTAVSFIATDETATSLNCTMAVNGSTQQNTSVANGSSTTFTFNNLADGVHSWNVSCTDGLNANTSLQQQFTIDVRTPNFISLETEPGSADALDPGTLIRVIGNVTDNSTIVDTVILQYQANSAGSFTNLTMSLNASTGLWNVSFNATSNDTYTLRLVAYDTVGNTDTSQNLTRSVQYEYAWNRTPERFTPVGIAAGQNGTLGILILNNTGDFPLNFTINSTYANTTFNVTFPLLLNATNATSIQVNVSAPGTAQVVLVTLTISASPNATPENITANGTIVVTEAQPFLAATFSTIPTQVQQGQENIEFTAQVENVGTANASNVTLFTFLPADWVVTLGDQNLSIDELTVGQIASNVFQIRIPSDAATGAQNVTANSSGVNSTGSDLGSLALVLGEVRIVTVTAPSAPLGGGGNGGGGGGAGGGGGGGGAPSQALQNTLGGKEFLETRERVELTRGGSQTFPLAITNVFADTTLYDVTVQIGGYLTQYITIDPPKLTDIRYGQTKYVTITVAAPAYKDRDTFDLTFLIKGNALASQSYRDSNGRMRQVNTLKEITEQRTVTLIIHEIAAAIAESYRETAEQIYAEFQAEGIPTGRLSVLLAELTAAYSEQDFGTVKRVSEHIAKLREEAIAAKSTLDTVHGQLAQAASLRIDTHQTQDLLMLAQAAFDREDFVLAAKRAREAQATYLLETQGKFDLLGLLQTYWWQFLLAALIGSIVAVLGYRKFSVQIIGHRLRNLQREEENIHTLVERLQQDTFGEKRMPITTYHRMTQEYEKRLTRIKQIAMQLRTKRAALLSPDAEEAQLQREQGTLMDEMRDSQLAYFQEKTLSRSKFFGNVTAQKRRMADLEHERLVAAMVHHEDLQHPMRRTWGKFQNFMRKGETLKVTEHVKRVWEDIGNRERAAWRKLERKKK